MPKIYKRTLAKNDLVECYVYLAENVSIDIADEFLKNAEASFNELAMNPFMGSPLLLQNLKLDGIRKWRVKKFINILIFYKPINNGVSIVRVIHASQNWWSILGLL